jgi:hypothetical protein
MLRKLVQLKVSGVTDSKFTRNGIGCLYVIYRRIFRIVIKLPEEAHA